MKRKKQFSYSIKVYDGRAEKLKRHLFGLIFIANLDPLFKKLVIHIFSTYRLGSSVFDMILS